MNKEDNMGNLKLNGRTIAIGILVILAVIAVVAILSNQGGNTAVTPTSPPASSFDDSGNEGGVQLGNLVTALNIDQNGCPVEPTNSFRRSDDIYVVVEDSDIPQGTTVFARLFREGSPVEDADVITADRDYDNTCIYFAFEATDTAEVLEAGDYSAQIIVNGNPGETVNFEVQ
jgi:hypothetical protein